jgi:hypothetical protein
MRIAEDSQDDRQPGGRGDEPPEMVYVWTLSAIVAAGRTLLTSNRSGPFAGFEVAQDVARDFAAKPAVLAVSIEPEEQEDFTRSRGRAEQPARAADGWPVLSEEQEAGIEALFLLLAGDRSLATYVKNYLDRLGVWKRYEDRFLDLFSKKY